MLRVPENSDHNFNYELQGDISDRKVINVNEKKKFTQKSAPYVKQTRELLLIQMNILILNIWKFIFHSINIYRSPNM